MNNLIKIALTLTFAAVISGHPPFILKKVRLAQYNLIKESQASKWTKAIILPGK